MVTRETPNLQLRVQVLYCLSTVLSVNGSTPRLGRGSKSSNLLGLIATILNKGECKVTILEELNITEEEFEKHLEEYITNNSVEEALYNSGLIDEEGKVILPEED